jgi:hypothetical protein
MKSVKGKKIPKLKYTFDQLASVRRMWGYDFSPDGKRMALVTDLDGQLNLWHLRVVKRESDQMVDALRKKGVTVEYMVFEDEGHGLTKTENVILAFKKAADFFFEHLLEQIPEIM